MIIPATANDIARARPTDRLGGAGRQRAKHNSSREKRSVYEARAYSTLATTTTTTYTRNGLNGRHAKDLYHPLVYCTVPLYDCYCYGSFFFCFYTLYANVKWVQNGDVKRNYNVNVLALPPPRRGESISRSLYTRRAFVGKREISRQYFNQNALIKDEQNIT